ncbi:MAG: SAM-dependent methyltransferase [Burkholderiales bacterium]|nr:MAG: SAM-dependent methyltransferase [Burkholderiales bacterium]
MGSLYLIPVPLGPAPLAACMPDQVLALCRRLDYFVAENTRSARAMLKRAGTVHALRDIEIRELNEHTDPASVPSLLEPLMSGRDGGLISEAGCPAIADPGASLVDAAHAAGLAVCPLVGPSALLLALMGSGLNGQRFAFAGYLPARAEERERALRELEARSARHDETQLFIETPYRAQAMLETAVSVLRPETRLALGCDLTLASERVFSRSVARWRRDPIPIGRSLVVFLLQATAVGSQPRRSARPRPR